MLSTGLRLGCLIALTVFAGTLGTARAQSTISALVNDEPVSGFDVAQRVRLMEATKQKATRAEVVNDLVEERIKLQEARRLKVKIDEAEVDRAFGSIAERVKMTPDQFGGALNQLGVNPKTLKDRLRADLAWRRVVQAKLRGTVRLREADVVSALKERNAKEGGGKTTEYLLSQVVFVVPKASGAGLTAQRRQEAEGLRSRFVSCAETLPKVRGLKDVVVKEVGRKRSEDLGKEMREMLSETAVNKLTKPNVTEGGVELIAVCEKRELEDDNAAEKQIRDEMMSGEMQGAAKKLMTELRAKAVVEMR